MNSFKVVLNDTSVGQVGIIKNFICKEIQGRVNVIEIFGSCSDSSPA